MKKSKLVISLMAGLLISTCAITGSVAWFTANDDITNTFTVGKISMKLDESKLGGTGRTEENQLGYKIIPGATITKDPTVTINTGSEKCYVFVCVDNGLVIPNVDSAAVITVDNAKWKMIGTKNTKIMYQYIGSKATTRVVDAKDAAKVLENVFGNVKIDGNKVTPENIEILSNKTITVKAYAHQAENIDEAAVIVNAKTYFGM